MGTTFGHQAAVWVLCNAMEKLHAYTRTGAVVQALKTHEIGR